MPQWFPKTRSGWWRSVRRVVLAVLGVVLIFPLLMSCAERSLLYPSRFRPAPGLLPMPEGVRELTVEHEQGVTRSHLYLGDGVTADRPGPVVIYSHGNGELIEDYFPAGLAGYRAMGVSVLMAEYRGTGNSDGKPTKAGIDADHVAFFDAVAGQPEVDADRIVLHGRSMGGGIVSSLAMRREPAALVLESAYSSIADFAGRMLVPAFLVKDNYDVTATLEAYAGPVFMVHSERDTTVPFSMSEKNRAARPSDLPPIEFVSYDLGHNDPMPSAFYEDVERFFRSNGILVSEAAAERSYDPPAAEAP